MREKVSILWWGNLSLSWFCLYILSKIMQELYKKDFDGWNRNKQYLEKSSNQLYPVSRQIWYVKLWINIWFEADGKWEYTRPVLIIQKIGSLFWCIPMTTKQKKNIFHYTLTSVSFWLNIISSLMLSQARIIDKKRFQEMIWYISVEEFWRIKKLLRNMYLPEV